MDFVQNYTKANCLLDTIKCYVAKILGAKVVTPLGRIVLLPKEYEKLAIITGNVDLLD